jgi:hypothetical protein
MLSAFMSTWVQIFQPVSIVSGNGEETSPPSLEDSANNEPSTVSKYMKYRMDRKHVTGECGTCLHNPAIDCVVPIHNISKYKHGWMAALPLQIPPDSQPGSMVFSLCDCLGMCRENEEEEEPFKNRSH